jgi:enterochelin esterase family protein
MRAVTRAPVVVRKPREVLSVPPGYDAGTVRYPVLYVHDGDDSIQYGAMDTVLDNLIARRELPPLIAVFVAPIHRVPE